MQEQGAIYVDPQMVPVLAAMRERANSRAPIWEIGARLARSRARADFTWWNAEPPVVRRVEDLAAEGAAGPVTVRFYDPLEADGLRPALVYFHGGGWVIGDLELEDSALRTLALASGVCILSVDYALAPEHKYPRPLEDCMAVAQWVYRNAERLSLDGRRIALGGASAGANLALSTALALRDACESWPRFLLLIHGVYSPDNDTPSHRRFGDGTFGLTTAQMEYFWDAYLEDRSQRADPRASPLYARLEGLPPTFLIAAGLDPLLDDSVRLSQGLNAAAVTNELRTYAGVVHGFTLMGRALETANVALRDAGAALRNGLA